MMKVDPRTASEIIRSHLANAVESQTVDPMEVHRQVYLHHVAQFLHMEPTPANMQRIEAALEHYGIDSDNFQEWPKHVHGRTVANEKEAEEAEREHAQREAEAAEAEKNYDFQNDRDNTRQSGDFRPPVPLEETVYHPQDKVPA